MKRSIQTVPIGWIHLTIGRTYSIPQSTDSTADETSSTGDSFLPGSTLNTRPVSSENYDPCKIPDHA